MQHRFACYLSVLLFLEKISIREIRVIGDNTLNTYTVTVLSHLMPQYLQNCMMYYYTIFAKQKNVLCVLDKSCFLPFGRIKIPQMILQNILWALQQPCFFIAYKLSLQFQLTSLLLFVLLTTMQKSQYENNQGRKWVKINGHLTTLFSWTMIRGRELFCYSKWFFKHSSACDCLPWEFCQKS